MKKQLLLGGFLAIASLAHAQTQWNVSGSNLYNTPANGKVSVGFGTAPTTRMLEVNSAGLDDGIEIKTPSGAGNYDAMLILNNRTTSGHVYNITSEGSGHTPNLPGSLSIWDATAGASRMFISASGDVGFGTQSPSAKVHVISSLIGIRGDAPGSAVVGNAIASGTTGSAYGVTGQGSGGNPENYGGYFYSSGAAAGITSYGVYARVFNVTSGGTNYGIYATVSGNGNSGNGPNWAGYFDGDVETTSAAYYTSDRRLKKEIKSIENSLSIISKLNPVNYKFNVEANPDINLPAVKQYGFISQEIQEIMPELTKVAVHPAKYDKETGKEIYPSKEILSLNYNGFIAILAKGIQEQQKMIEDQSKEIADLKKQMNAQNQTGNATGINQLNSAADGFTLDQNIPNPFSSETVIKYTLPQEIKTASLIVYDLSGKQLTSFPLEKTSTSITITSEKLAAGIYIYSVMADGKIMNSKRMIVADKQ